ncbi:MAG: hypothetical protein KDN22_07905 [Verrucomicrobiae bacterium]|nr:hypothetical protein [Verrucomicrobiae bacterium]
MGILRILLVVGLIAGCAFVALRAPWRASLTTDFTPTATVKDLGNAPIWAPPATPKKSDFKEFSGQDDIQPGTPGYNVVIDTGLRIVVELDKRAMFGKACTVTVGLFFLFGIAGTIIQRRPDSSDVAFSLWLSLGMLLGIVTSASLGHAGVVRSESLPYFSECLLVGFIAGLLIALKTHPLFGPAKGRKGSA